MCEAQPLSSSTRPGRSLQNEGRLACMGRAERVSGPHRPEQGSGGQGPTGLELRLAKADATGLTHLFVAAPNAFTFFLGQRQTALGPVRLYEFDFDGGRGRSYSAALTLPLVKASA